MAPKGASCVWALKLQVHFDSTQRSNMFISRLHPCSSKLMKLRESRNLKNSKISFASSMYNDVTIQNSSKIYLLSIWHEIPIFLSIPIYRNIGKCDKNWQKLTNRDQKEIKNEQKADVHTSNFWGFSTQKAPSGQKSVRDNYVFFDRENSKSL